MAYSEMRKKQFILGTTSGGGCSGADWSIVNSLLFRVKGGGEFLWGEVVRFEERDDDIGLW